MKKKTDLVSSGRKRPFHLKWWHIVLGVLAIVIIAVAFVYLDLSGQLHSGTPGLVAGNISSESIWNKISSGTSQISTSELDNDSFNNIEQKNYPIIKVPQKYSYIENVLLVGLDGTSNKGHRSDTLMIATINTKTNTLKLTSILRDCRVYFPDRKSYNKINAAYAYGGPGQAINIINYNFHTDIQKYITVNFSGFASIINALGGVTITLTTAEARSDGVGHYSAGTYLLTGHQALMYARIRHIDSDFHRVQRQRNVLLAIYQKLKSASITKKTSVATTCLKYVNTNVSDAELLGKLTSFSSLMNNKIQQYTVPQDNMYTSVSSPIYYIYLKWSKQLPAMQKFIYGK